MRFIFWTLSVLPFLTSAASECTEKLFFTYKLVDNSPHKGPFGIWRCTAFTPSRQLLRIRSIDAATITCSNVSSTVLLNYAYNSHYYPQDLMIVDSKIPKFPRNSSLSSFPTIRKLVLKNLDIKDISPGAFNALEILQTLDLSSNKLTQTPSDVFDELSTLKVLDLSNNSINNVDRDSLFGLVQLKELYLNRNNLTVLYDNTFKDLIALEILDISDNPLEELQDVGFDHLKKLILKNAHLKSFDIDMSNSSLTQIEMSGGKLETINFGNFPSLLKLDLSRNRLEAAQNWNHLNCVDVFLANNNLKEVEIPQKVQFLDLQHNHINTLKNKFQNQNSSLKILYLGFNEITTIQDGVFWGLSNLKNLDLQHNHIKNLDGFTNCSSLISVNLSFNNISQISTDVFKNSHYLKLLNVSHNNLITLNSEMLPKINALSNLYVDNNNIIWFDAQMLLYHFDNLEIVSMNHNLFSCEFLKDIVHLLKLRNVKIIDIETVDSDNKDNIDGIVCTFHKKS